MARIYTLHEKIAALDHIADEGLTATSRRLKIPLTHLRHWQKDVLLLRRQMADEQKERAALCIAQAQMAMAEAGPYSRLYTGTSTMPEPNPAKPRNNPAAMAVAGMTANNGRRSRLIFRYSTAPTARST